MDALGGWGASLHSHSRCTLSKHQHSTAAPALTGDGAGHGRERVRREVHAGQHSAQGAVLHAHLRSEGGVAGQRLHDLILLDWSQH